MIVFDLKCAGGGHVFEAWFGSSAAWEAQRAAGLVACPICGDDEVAKAVMAPNVTAKGNQRTAAPVAASSGDLPPPVVKAAMEMIAVAQAKMLEKSQWVGTAFADKARAMHLGDEPTAQIHGQATPEQAQELIEEGVSVAPLIVPVVPPEQCN